MRAEITALLTYGYRRAVALVNRTRALMGLQSINHKRFYRVMKEKVCWCQKHLNALSMIACMTVLCRWPNQTNVGALTALRSLATTAKW